MLHDAAKDKDWRVRLAVAESLVDHHRDPDSLKIMRALMAEDSQVIREECAKSVGRNKVEPLFPELIVTMREGNLRCKKAAWEAMKTISKQEFSLAPDLWAKWYSEFKKGTLTEEGKLAQGERVSVSTYYNFKIFSDRVMFVVDTSGSMKWLEAPPQRIDVAKKQLVMAIKSLNEKTLFNVMTFASDMHMWRPSEVVATESNIKDCLEWMDKSSARRAAARTRTAPSRSTLEEESAASTRSTSCRTVCRLPVRWRCRRRFSWQLREMNRFRKVVFNTIALVFGKSKIEKAWKYEDPGEMGAFMRRMAEETGGESVVIDRPFFDLKD